MSDSDNYLKILEKISEVGVDVAVVKTEMSHFKEDMTETKERLKGIEEHDAHQNSLLDRHILGVKTAMESVEIEREARKSENQLIQKQIQEIDARLKKAEFVPNLASNLKTALKWIAGVCVALGTIGKFLHWF